jgi:hypothetical protein
LLLLIEIVHWKLGMKKMRMFSASRRLGLTMTALAWMPGCGGDDADLSEGAKEVPQGALVNYHPNGAKKLEEFYKGDLLHGLSTVWDENGTIMEQDRYENGKLIETLYEDGIKVSGQ